LKDQYGNNLNGQKLTVTLAGPGLISVQQDQDGITGAMANRVYADGTANTGNTWQIGIAPDGTAGRLDVTISVGTSVIGVKSLTFYGSYSRLIATPVLIATANGATTQDAVVVCAVDANGTTVPSETIYASSGDTTVASVETSDTGVTGAVTEVLSVASATAIDPTTYVATKAIGCAGFNVIGASQTVKDSAVLTFRNAAAATDATVTTTATIKVGSVTASAVTVAFDKASYSAGSKATVTLTLKDATGRLIGAGPGTSTLAGVLTSSASLQGAALFAANNNLKLGVATADVYMPYANGTVTITGTTGTASTTLESVARGVSLAASATVTASADSTSAQLASLIKKINDLQKLIAKIQKRLGVK
jgi:hypothetical protein